MAGTNTTEDILKYVINREIEANIFYNLIAESVENPQIKQICLELAEEELGHKAELELEMMKIGKVIPDKNTTEAASFIAKTNPLDYILDSNKILKLSIEELLLLAINKENDSFRLYIDMASMTQDEEARDILIDLAEEEAKHKLRFELEHERLKSAEDSDSDD